MIEVLKQALEALEDFVDVIKYDNEQDDIGRRACCDVLSYNPHSENCKAKQAITAIKEAIREHAMYEVQRLGQEIEQEPVAWMHIMDNTEGIKANGAGIVSITQKRKHPFGKAGIDFSKSYPVTSTPLYTHPPQRTWVGLTKDEVDSWNLPDHPTVFEFAQFIESKLKEKNI